MVTICWMISHLNMIQQEKDEVNEFHFLNLISITGIQFIT